MTASELLLHQLDDTGHQLQGVFNGIDESTADAKLVDGAMTPRETAAHLIECCYAFLTEADGGSFDWGSFQIEDQSWSHLMDTFAAKRKEVVDRVANGDDRTLKLASAYVVLHETYHVGQMAQMRISKTADWDPYSIYKKG
jgi:uncharacterized damage-inducible protein DinB